MNEQNVKAKIPEWASKVKAGTVIWCLWNEGYWSFGDERTVEWIDENYISFGKHDTYTIESFRWRNYALKTDPAKLV